MEKSVQVFTLKGGGVSWDQLWFNHKRIRFSGLIPVSDGNEHNLAATATNAKGGAEVRFLLMGTAVMFCCYRGAKGGWIWGMNIRTGHQDQCYKVQDEYAGKVLHVANLTFPEGFCWVKLRFKSKFLDLREASDGKIEVETGGGWCESDGGSTVISFVWRNRNSMMSHK